MDLSEVQHPVGDLVRETPARGHPVRHDPERVDVTGSIDRASLDLFGGLVRRGARRKPWTGEPRRVDAPGGPEVEHARVQLPAALHEQHAVGFEVAVHDAEVM